MTAESDRFTLILLNVLIFYMSRVLYIHPRRKGFEISIKDNIMSTQ